MGGASATEVHDAAWCNTITTGMQPYRCSGILMVTICWCLWVDNKTVLYLNQLRFQQQPTWTYPIKQLNLLRQCYLWIVRCIKIYYAVTLLHCFCPILIMSFTMSSTFSLILNNKSHSYNANSFISYLLSCCCNYLNIVYIILLWIISQVWLSEYRKYRMYTIHRELALHAVANYNFLRIYLYVQGSCTMCMI